MSYDIGPRIGIEGDTQFRAALKTINSQTRSLAAEMKALTSSFSAADSQESKLTAQNKVLQKSLQASAQKVELLAKQYQKERSELEKLGTELDAAKVKFGEQSKEVAKAQNAYNRQAERVNKLATQMHNAQADANKFTNALRGNEQQLDSLAKAATEPKTALQKLTDEIDSQKSKLSDLKTQYANAVLTFGKTSTEARQLAGQIKDLNAELDENEKKLSEAEGASKNFSDAASSMIAGAFGGAAAAGIGLLTDALSDVASATAGFAVESQQSMNDLQARTGATEQQVQKLGEVAETVYKHNFGDSLSEVADSVATVNQLLGDMPSDEMVRVTENAYALRDTFGFDICDTLRTAKTLMKNFGLSSDDSFALIAQGAQRGLDFSGELLDTINEYSVQFSAAGLSAEDMFDIFQSGADAGAFNLDKIGDAVKELSIRIVDGSDTTAQGLKAVGLNVDEMTEKFAQGGDGAKEAFRQIIQGLADMDDPLKQNQAGVDLFGSMWEDLGPTVITQLSNIRDEYDQTADTMEQIKDIKYDDIGAALSGVGRVLQSNLISPIEDRLLPTLSDLPGKIDGAFQTAGDFGAEFKEKISPITDVLGEVGQGIQGSFSDAITEVKTAAQELQPIFEPLLPVLSALATILGVSLVGAIGIAAGFISGLAGAAAGLVQIVGGIVGVFGGALDVIVGLVTGNGELIQTGWQGMCDGVSNIFGGMVSTVTGLASGLWSGVSGFFGSLAESAGIDVQGMKDSVTTKFSELSSGAISKAGEFQAGVSGKLSQVKGNFSEALGNAKATVDQKLSDIRNAFSSKLESAREAVSNVIGKIKGLFNFSWSLPKLKTPYFTIKPPGWSVGDLLKGVIPSLSVGWHADGGIFTSPTLLASAGGALHGVGEAGPEAILPLSQLWDEMENRMLRVMQAIDSYRGNQTPTSADYTAMAAAMAEAFLAKIGGTMNWQIVDGAGRIIARAIAPAIDEELGQRHVFATRRI